MVDSPQDQAQDDTEHNGTRQGKRDRPAAPAPGEVARKTANGQIQTSQRDDDQSGNDQKESDKDEDTAKVRHEIRLRAGEHRGGLTKQLGWLARLGKDAYGPRKPTGLLAHVEQIGIKAGKDEDAA